MNDNRLHEPQTIRDIKNGVGYFVVGGFLFVIVILLFGGLIAPVFWPWVSKKVDEIVTGDPKLGPRTYMRRVMGTTLTLWFFGSWILLILIMNGWGQNH